MQADPLTFKVEEDGVHGTDGTGSATLSYTRHLENEHNTTYIKSDTHTRELRDQLQVYRNYAKPNGQSRGSDKCRLKFTVDREVTAADGVSTVVLPHIIEVSFSIPLGTTTAQMLALRERVAGALRNPDFTGSLNDSLEI